MTAPILFARVACAQETIENFDVDVAIENNGTAHISESITVNAQGINIRHGIYRDIPTSYTTQYGNMMKVPLRIEKILYDGREEDYHTEKTANGIRIYVGKKDTNVPVGRHTYVIDYDVRRVVGFFDTGDEFYWNVTGNDWLFPIHKASIRVVFPEGAAVTKFDGFTGYRGSTGKNFRGRATGNVFEAVTTGPLQVAEGLTIVAAVPQGTIKPESTLQKIQDFLNDNAAWLVLVVSIVVMLNYLILMWMKFGRDRSGTIFPRFDIPEGITPDLLRYIIRQKYDVKTFVCLIVYAAAEKYLMIADNESKTSLERLKAFPTDTKTGGVMGVMGFMFRGRTSMEIPKRNFFRGASEVSKELANDLGNGQTRHEKFLADKRDNFFDTHIKIKVMAGVIALTGTALAYCLGETGDQRTGLLIASAVIQGGILKAFWIPLNKRTKRGQEIADYAAGLRLYLSVAEEARMNALYPKSITPQMFEKFLPYALALDVEQEWCEYFSALVEAGLAVYSDDDQEDRRWHRSFRTNNLFGLSHNLNALPASIASAVSPPGSKSGFSGGGSGGRSGGGGGGGGGGGW